MHTLAHPFRFVGGRVVHNDDTTEHFAAQRIAAAIMTSVGELPVTPLFGSVDPEFMSFDIAAFLVTASNHLDGIIIDDVTQTISPDGTPKVLVKFTRV